MYKVSMNVQTESGLHLFTVWWEEYNKSESEIDSKNYICDNLTAEMVSHDKIEIWKSNKLVVKLTVIENNGESGTLTSIHSFNELK